MMYRRCFTVLILLLFVAACGISGDLKKNAKSRKQAMDAAVSDIEAAKQKYLQWQKTSEYKSFAPYAERYQWESQYDAAMAEARSAREIWAEIEKILDENRKEDETRLLVKIQQLNRRLRQALANSKKPNQQIGALRALMADPVKYIQKAEEEMARMESILAEVVPVKEKAVSDSKTYQWNKENDINARFAGLKEMVDKASTALNMAKAQQGKTAPDFAVMHDNLQAVELQLKELAQADTHLRTLLDELNRSYTKRLVDMRHVYTATIGRTSWSNYYDYPKETDYEYSPRQVSEATFQYLARRTDAVATGLRYLKLYMPSDMWRELKINPTERLPRGDDDAEFWVSETEIQYYHRYMLIENGQETETDWQAVDEEDYAANLDNLGMDIESKPYGFYASEVIEDASPPAMSYVGNEQYGTWRRDSSGHSFWAFYGQYAFLNAMLGGRRYSYNEWDRWRTGYRGRAPYYGKNNDGSAVWGTSGSTVRTDPRYRTSVFARQGGMKSAPANIRSAAGSVRGRGPGSRGK